MSNTKAFSSVIAGVLVLVLVVKAQDARGTPVVDYPNYDAIPKTSFSCSEQKYIPGLYADMETGCQVFHFCEENIQESFLCPPGMTFNQESLECGSWDNFNCSLTPQFYSVNTGPEMDNARRNILMVLQLKNRSRSKLSNRPSDVYARITSLYDGTVGEEQSELPGADIGVNAKSNDGVSHEVGLEEMPEAQERSEENEHRFNQDLSGIDESTLNDGSVDISEESEHSEIFYDPVTERYFVDYDPLRTVNEVSKEEFDKVGSLSYDGFSKRFGLSYNENGDEMQSDSESEYSKENDLKELSEMLATGAREEQLKTMWNVEPSTLKRVRRRPLYKVVQDDTAAGVSGVARNIEYPIDSTDTEVNFEFSRITSEENERLEKLASEVSYEVPELQYSNIASTGNPEIPQTLEIDQAVLSIPEDNGRGFWKSVPSEDEKVEDPMQDNPQSYQTADEYSYIDISTPVDYRQYFTDYTEVDTEISGEPEFVPETRDSEENNWYQDESLDSEDSMKSEDTYMVIPDEYDNAFDDYSETNGQTETYSAQSDATGQFGASRDFSPSYISPAVYAPVAPYWMPPPYYYPDGYGSRQAFNTEHFFNRDSFEYPEYVGKPQNDQNYQYFPLADSGLYAYGGSPNFPGHVYDYGTHGYVYPYTNVYDSPYSEKFGYDTSEVKVVTESSILNENPEAAVVGNSDYSEPEIQYWAESFSTESPEIEEVTESVYPTEESLDNVYITSDGEIGEMPSSTSDAPLDENTKEAETFYLFDFDENSDEEFIPEATDEVLDNIELFQAEEPSRRNESSGDMEGVNVDSESDSKGVQAESHLEFEQENLGRSETVENEKSIDSTFQTEGTSHDENLGPASASGITAVNSPQTHSRRQPRSYGSNVGLSRDSKFLMDNIYSESNLRFQDAVLAQPYVTEDGSLQSNMGDGFFSRTGDAGLSRASKLSELQKRILSLKQGKLGTFKKYMNPGGKN